MSSFAFHCLHCQSSWQFIGEKEPLFCPICASALETSSASASNIENVSPERIGPYQILENLGRGGMGEVFLAYDTSCGRQIALKRIRQDLTQHPQIHNRFLKEARITCQLTHPAIIPIYMIHGESQPIYYTMPFVEGETLKQILRKTRQQEKKGEKLDHIGGSIPALMRIFVTICQAVAYAHDKGVLHRDLKPENIIIGKYGEVLILDWGLAKMIEALEEEKNGTDPRSPKRKNGDITHTGKVVGTIAYMAPERALGHPATIQTDIYSLGVILYQMLTLRSPFKRGTLEEFKKKIPLEEWIDPVLAAPYRDVPGILARITEKCMANQISQRYQSVNELIHDVENYIEGRSEWFQIAELDIKNKADWEFQENVLIAEHIAITRMTEEAEWVGLMVSRSSFSGNTKLEADICLGEEGNGIGFLMSVPETNQRTHITDGYCLWLGSDINKSTKLLRSNVEVMQASDIFLKRHQWYHIRIEKIEQTLHVYIDDHLQFSYIAHIPLIGTHVGLLARDADFQISSLKVSVGSLNIMVNCLAVPDAFLAHKDFDQALSEYRRIASSFRDRAEGREARFRAGLTLIEKAKESSEKEALLDESLAEFEKLHGTPGAPLEYLGKALVYQTLSDYEEEIKCFELAYRRYPQHPLLPVLQEQVISRMHTVSRHNRIATYNFILLAIRLLPLVSTDIHTNRLFSSLQKHWEPLPFIENPLSTDKFLQYQHFAIQLAFWLAKPYVLGEIIEDIFRKDPSALVEMGNALFSLIKLGAWQYSKAKLKSDLQSLSHLNDPILIALQQDIKNQQTPLEQNLDFYLELLNQRLEPCYVRSLVHFLDLALDQEKMWLIHAIEEKLEDKELAFDKQLKFNIRIIWAYLLENNWEKAAEIIERYPFELINKESTPLYFLYACLLQATEGVEAAQAQFKNVMRVSYPRSWILGCHYLAGYLSLNDPWFEKAFLWEKRELFRQLTLYYHCAQDKTQETQFRTLYNQQFIYVDPQ